MIVEGIAYGWWETGTEGVHWAVQANWKGERWSYDDLHVLQDGDRLQITDTETNAVVFDGAVELDTEACKVEGQEWGQGVCGFYVHGVQVGVDPERWFGWFMHEPKGRYLARLEREEKVNASSVQKP